MKLSRFITVSADNATSRNANSLGLGLYIVQAIVTAHQGTIAVSSTAAGTTFTVRLPRTIAHGTKPQTRAS